MAIRISNKGVPVDMDALMAANKNVSALGNMRVNASGDVINSRGEIVQRNEDRVRAYYKNNPKSSTGAASLKNKLTPKDVAESVPGDASVPTAETLKENKRTRNKREQVPVAQPDEFNAPQEPLGYREVQLPNGDIEMVPYYREEDQ